MPVFLLVALRVGLHFRGHQGGNPIFDIRLIGFTLRKREFVVREPRHEFGVIRHEFRPVLIREKISAVPVDLVPRVAEETEGAAHGAACRTPVRHGAAVAPGPFAPVIAKGRGPVRVEFAVIEVERHVLQPLLRVRRFLHEIIRRELALCHIDTGGVRKGVPLDLKRDDEVGIRNIFRIHDLSRDSHRIPAVRADQRLGAGLISEFGSAFVAADFQVSHVPQPLLNSFLTRMFR